jgi:hypothetical protein
MLTAAWLSAPPHSASKDHRAPAAPFGTGPMDLKQSTFEEVIDSERQLVLDADARYGKFYRNARACSIFFFRSIVSVELSHHETFGRFFSQMKKHHIPRVYDGDNDAA